MAASKGVFWVVDGKLLAFPFSEAFPKGVAKSGDTYNHQKLWEQVRPKGCGKSYNYYPRGRVEITKRGKAVVYLSPHISQAFLQKIQSAFGIDGAISVKYDHSPHYRCHLDETKDK